MDSESKSLSNQEFSCPVVRNSGISVEPNQILFRNYKLGQPITQVLHIINTSGKEQRFHILPLETGPFSLKYEKKRNLLPGMNQTIQVKFTPKDYLQCLQTLHIHCPNEENLSIPISAFPSPELSGFPSTLHFPNTAIHMSTSLQFTLTSDIFIPFEFEMIFNPPTEVFSVQPSSGILPAKGSLQIAVTFNPLKLRTTISNLELTLPEIDSKIRACSCTGSCLPNRVNPPDKIISERKIPSMTLQKQLTKRKFITNSKRNKPLISKTISESKGTSPSLRDKERDFLLAVRQGREDEKMNQLKWSTNIGCPALTQPVLSLLTYQRDLNTSPLFSTSSETRIECVKLERTNDKFRTDHHIMVPYGGKDQRLNWKEKRELLCRFSLAAKRVVIQLRAERRLKCIRVFLQQVKDLNLSRDEYDTVFAKPKSSKNKMTFCIPNEPIPFLFIREEYSSNTAPEVPFVPLEIVRPVWEFEEEEPVFQTIPPDYSQQQNYKILPLASVDDYLPFKFGQKKRKGAEHEYIGIETEKREDVITEETIRTLSLPNSPTTLEIIPPVDELDPEYQLLPIESTPLGHWRTDQNEEQKEYLNNLKHSLTVEKDKISILEEVEPYQASKFVPSYPEDLLTEVYPLEIATCMKGNLEAYPTDSQQKLITRESPPTFNTVTENRPLSPESEKYVRLDREEKFRKIQIEKLERGQGFTKS